MSMKKLALFVEGQTEQIFVRNLLMELAGRQNIVFHEEQVHGAGLIPLRSDPIANEQYFALLVDCRGDEQVASTILNQLPSIAKANYDLVLGLRDLYPQPRANLASLKAALEKEFGSTTAPKVQVVVAVMEVEAWFAQEYTHFPRINSSLNMPAIKAVTGCDPSNDNTEDLDHPAKYMNDAYQVAGERYAKSRRHVERTVSAIDYVEMYMEARKKSPSFDSFVSAIDSFLTA